VLLTVIEIDGLAPRKKQFNEAKEIENWATEHRHAAGALHVVTKFVDDTMSPMLKTVTVTAYSVSSNILEGTKVIEGLGGVST